MPELSLIPAAQYLRMSTDHQRYSLENQAAAIAEYCLSHGFDVVATYRDPGRSGLTLRERPALQALLRDAIAEERRFKAVLVYDVSRWGRFQDPDQSAHYEFICREAGLQVQYCAEPFDNDGSASSIILKQVKRLMAAEYVRELSAKAVRGHAHQAALGHYQGGVVPLGVQRVIVNARGEPIMKMARGQRKALASDRIQLIWGPPEELATVRRIFREYVHVGRSTASIAQTLNAEGRLGPMARPWSRHMIRSVLRNELLIGNYVYNKSWQRLRGPRRKNPRELWKRVRVMPPIVSQRLFNLAADRLGSFTKEWAGREPIRRSLRRLLDRHGYISAELVASAPELPSYRTIRRYFGGLKNACADIGYDYAPLRWGSKQAQSASDAQLLRLLIELHAARGYVSSREIEAAPNLPCADVFRSRFGSLRKAYELAGLSSSRTALNKAAYSRMFARGEAPSQRARERIIAAQEEQKVFLLEELQRLATRDGFVTVRSINAEPGLWASTYRARFGSLVSAYQLAGLPAASRSMRSRQGRERRRLLLEGEAAALRGT